jgi:16S rRNA (guanine(1405)-N(7))-methyltransferase
MINFLNQFFALTSTNGQAFVCDLISGPPAQRVDLALALKLLPPLEQLDKAAAPRLLDQVQADYLLVSFPAHSLGGRARGMTSYYAEHFAALLAGRPWRVQRFDFASELAFLVQLTA